MSPCVLLTSQRRVLPKGVLVQRVPFFAQRSVLLPADLRKRLRGAVLFNVTDNLQKVALQAEQEGCGGGERPVEGTADKWRAWGFSSGWSGTLAKRCAAGAALGTAPGASNMLPAQA